MSQPQWTWVAYGEGTATVAANNVASRLSAAAEAEGRFFANFGQGREQITLAKDVLERVNGYAHTLKSLDGYLDPAYNAAATCGGAPEFRAIAQAWLHRFIGQNDETFILPKTGRAGLSEMFLMFPNHDLVSPYEQWPMIKSIGARHGVVDKLGGYDLSRGKLAKGISKITRDCDDVSSQIWYVGIPSNPRGLFPTPKELNDLLAMLKDIEPGKRPKLLFDIPYFHAAKQSQYGLPHLVTGLSTEFFQELQDMGVPYVSTYSFSKAFGSAKPGWSFLAVSPDLVEPMRKQLIENTNGISYHPADFQAMLETLHMPEADHKILQHFEQLAGNYRANCQTLQSSFSLVERDLRKAFGDAAQFGLLDGDPMMTRLFAVPLKSIIGRVVDVPAEFGLPDNQFVIRDTKDFLSCIANLSGVVLVDNGLSKNRKNILVRVATAEPKERFLTGSMAMTNTLVKVAESRLLII